MHASTRSLGPVSRRQALAGFAGLTAALPLAQVLAQSATPDPASADQLLFVQVAEAGIAKQNDDGYQLIFSHASGQTLYFSDRPERIVGIIATQEFLDGLATLGGDPPNAALALQEDEDAGIQVAVLELFEGTFDDGLLTYSATIIDPSAVPELTAANLIDHVPPTFAQATMFIDGVGRGQMLDDDNGDQSGPIQIGPYTKQPIR